MERIFLSKSNFIVEGEIMRKSGRTPLFRARRLEKVLDLGEIFLKLEGANPSGHIYDRIAEVIVKDAVFSGFQHILINGSEYYIQSVMFFAKLSQLQVKVPLFKQEKWKTARLGKDVLLDLRDNKDPSSRPELRDLAEKNHMYFACEWELNTTITHFVLEEMAKECLERMDFKVDTISVQLGYGYALSSIYRCLIKSWVNEELSLLPQLLCDARPCQDMLNQSGKYMHSDQMADLEKNLMKIIIETRVDMIELEEADLKQAVSMLREYENVIVSRKEAYAMAAFIKKSQQGLLKSGKHLIILNDAKSEVEVNEIKSFKEKSKDDFVNLIGTWLSPYNDSVAETLDAIEKAMKEGFLLIAKRNGEEQGICIIVNMGFERFIPTYHLAYIGVKAGNQGRGVASAMIKRAVEVTNGNLSLHVDLDNKRAKKLYSKMGFEHKYDRMIFIGSNDS